MTPPPPPPFPLPNKSRRKRRAATSSASRGSKIVEVIDDNQDGTQTVRRIGRLVSLQGISSVQQDEDGSISRPIDKTFFYNSVAAFLAAKHFNERRGDVLPWLPSALRECNFYLDYEFRDTQWSGLEAAKQLADATGALTLSTGVSPTTTTAITSGITSGSSPTSFMNDNENLSTTTSITIISPPPPTDTNTEDTPPTRTAPPRTNPPDRTLPPRTTTNTTTTTIQVISSSSASETAASTANAKGPLHKRERKRRTRAIPSDKKEQQPYERALATSTPSPPQQLPPNLDLEPFGIFGAYWSSSTKPLSILSGGLGLPHLSGASTSAELETTSPMFARTVTSNDGDAKAAILYYKDLGVTHLAVIFIQDSWGINYHASLYKYANAYGIQMKSFPYDKSCPKQPHGNGKVVCDVEMAIQKLQQSQYRHVFAIMHNWKQVISLAYDYGIVGTPDYSWIGAEEKKWTGDAFYLEKNEVELAQALHGIGTLNIYFELVPAFEEALEEIAYNPELQQEYINTLHDPSVVEEYDFPRYDPTGFTNSIFDGVLAMGLAACNASEAQFMGEEFYQTLVDNIQFEGVSGKVAFDPITGNRRQGMRYSIEYVVLSDERTTQDAYRFESKLATVVAGDTIRHYNPFVYYDNTTNVPPSLPPLVDYNYNLISQSEQIIGYVMASIVILASLISLVWVIYNRNIFVVRASQPIFLCQLCFGTFIMALAVFPASLPGASTSLVAGDGNMTMACMSQLWLVFLGFVTAFSAVFAKTYRLNKIMGDGIMMRRIRVEAHDVMAPFFILMFINVLMLLCITFVSPYQYQRVDMESYDTFGRSTESFGSCRPENNLFYLFLIIMSVSNGVGVLVALYQAWKARHLPMEFSESYYLALSLASFTETMCLGGPILIVSYNSPSAWYLLSSTILCIGCLTILLPIMLPKYAARHQQQRGITVTRAKSGTVGGNPRTTLSRVGVGSGSIYVSGLGSSSTIEHTPSTQNLGRGQLAIHNRGSSISESSIKRGGGSQSSIRSWTGGSSLSFTNHRPNNPNPSSRRNSANRLSTVNSLPPELGDDDDDDEEDSPQSRRRSSRKEASQQFWSSVLSQGLDSSNVSAFSAGPGVIVDADKTPPKRNSSHAASSGWWDGASDQERAQVTIQESIRKLQELSGLDMSSSASNTEEQEEEDKMEDDERDPNEGMCSENNSLPVVMDNPEKQTEVTDDTQAVLESDTSSPRSQAK